MTRSIAACVCALVLSLPAIAAADFTPAPGSPAAVGAAPFWVSSADFDGDDRADLASANTSGTVSVLLRQADGSYAEEAGSPIAVGRHPAAVATADFDADGRPDLAVSNFVSNTVTILLRRATGGFVEETGSPIAAGPAPHSLLAGDFDGDGRPDLALPDYGGGGVTVLLRQAGGGFAEEDGSPFPTGSGPTQLAAVDFDADGRLDLAATGFASDDVTILLRQAGGGFAQEDGSPVAVGADPVSPAAADLNGDGRPDLAVTNEAADTITVLLRRAGGGFAEQAGSPYAAGDGPYGLVAADLDDDGRTDLAASNEHSNDVTVLLGTAAGFAPAPFSPLAAGRTPLQLEAADLDGDDRTDLAVPNNGDDTVSILLQRRPAPPAPAPPRNLTLPSIVPEPGKPSTYRCLPGTWAGRDPARPYRFSWQRITPDKDFLDRVRADAVSAGETYRATAETTKQLRTLSFRFQCVVEAANAGGSTSAVSPRRDLTPVLDPLGGRVAHGNFRIRGIDVFQVIQPTAGARAFGYDPNVGAGEPSQAFGWELAGGGTPTSYRRTFFGGELPEGANAQRTPYAGVTFDATKPATAVVYVDMSVLSPGYSAAQPVEVTLLARANGAPLAGAITQRTTVSHFGATPYVTAAERGEPGAGVQFAIPALWFEHAASGARLDLEARVAFPVSFTSHPVQCPDAPCIGDDRYRLDDLPVHRLPLIRVRSVQLREAGDTWTTTGQQVLQRAAELFPGGERMAIADSGLSIPIETITHWTLASPECAAWKDAEQGLRICRMAAIDTLLNQWEAANQGSAYDVLMGIHEYDGEPGWAQTGTRPTFPALPATQGHPTFTANRGDQNRPLTAAAHELGHILGLPHAGRACPTPIGTPLNQTGPGKGQAGEYWPGDDRGRLQGVKFDRTARTAGGRVDAAVDSGDDPLPLPDREREPNEGNLVDLMSYCSVFGDDRFPWLSARNWNHAFRVLQDWVGRLAPADAAARLASVSGSRDAFAVGVIGPGGGRIDRVVAPDEDSKAPAAIPSSPVRLRALDAGGAVLRDTGVEIRGASEAPPGSGGSFAGPVPAGAAAVELVRDGVVLHRLQRSRPPSLRLLAPRRGARARGALDVRWAARDPHDDGLEAAVEYSPDGGRTWTGVFLGPDRGRARIAARALPASRDARVRVIVSNGFGEARVTSKRISSAGTAATVRIVRPDAGEPLRTGAPTLLIGSALDDHGRALRGRSLTWYAGRTRLGAGERLAARLPGGRYALRLVARDRIGRAATASRRVDVVRPPLRLLRLDHAKSVKRGARLLAVTISASEPAVLRAAGRSYRVSRRARRIVLALPRRPKAGPVRIACRLATARDRVEGSIEVRRGA